MRALRAAARRHGTHARLHASPCVHAAGLHQPSTLHAAFTWPRARSESNMHPANTNNKLRSRHHIKPPSRSPAANATTAFVNLRSGEDAPDDSSPEPPNKQRWGGRWSGALWTQSVGRPRLCMCTHGASCAALGGAALAACTPQAWRAQHQRQLTALNPSHPPTPLLPRRVNRRGR